MKKHVFLIDDDHNEMKIFYESLNDLPGSYKCTCATNGEQGMEMLKYLTPDFIIADYDIPPYNGLRLFTEIRAIKRLRDVPFFLYSSELTDELIQKAQELGIKKCVKKPDNTTRMSNLLHHILESDLIHN